MLSYILLIFSLIILWAVVFKIQKDYSQEIDELFKMIEEGSKRENILLKQKIKIMSIIVDGKKQNEVSYQTLDKIEKELFG